jgi:hypothetical protein
MTELCSAQYSEYVVPQSRYGEFVLVAQALGVLATEYPQESRVGIQATLQQIMAFNEALSSYERTKSLPTDPKTDYQKRHQAHRASLLNL